MIEEVAIGSIATIIGVWLGGFVLEAAVRAAGRGLRPDVAEGALNGPASEREAMTKPIIT